MTGIIVAANSSALSKCRRYEMIRDEQLEKAADIDVAHPDENVMVRAA